MDGGARCCLRRHLVHAHEGAESGHGPTKGTLRSSLLWVSECGAARLSDLHCPFPNASALPDIACTDGRSQLMAVSSEDVDSEI